MKSALNIIFLLFISLAAPLYSSPGNTLTNSKITEKQKIFLSERILFLRSECRSFLSNAGWSLITDGDQIIAYRLDDRYDEISVRIETGYYDGLYTFVITVNKNSRESIKIFNISESVANDNARLRDIFLSAVVPSVVMREGIGDFRKAYSSIFSFGYARTNDTSEFYPAYTQGNLHISWKLVYDPGTRLLERNRSLSFGDYMNFNFYFDWANAINENFFNIDLLLFGKNKYEGSRDHGTRLMYGFFNGLEYFRPGFSDTTMKWDREIYHKKPFIQYTIWRALEGLMLISRQSGSSVYSAEFMLGAGLGVGPSSLFLSGITEDEEKSLSRSFRSIEYRKQNYYFSYSFPARILLTADHLYGFRFEAGYNYYFFIPVIRDDLYDMLHIIKCSAGYYLYPDVLLNVQYERWFVESMLHHKTRTHGWNRLIIEFRNYF
jgi:hypothetical protein